MVFNPIVVGGYIYLLWVVYIYVFVCVVFYQNQQRELTVRHARETEKEMKKRLEVQKDEYEETVKRHLGFIDQVRDILYLDEVRNTPLLFPVLI